MSDPRKRREFTIHNLLSNNSPFSWRALFAFVTTTAISTALLYFGKLQPDNWVDLMMWIGGFFITGETAKKFVKKQQQNDEVLDDTQT